MVGSACREKKVGNRAAGPGMPVVGARRCARRQPPNHRGSAARTGRGLETWPNRFASGSERSRRAVAGPSTLLAPERGPGADCSTGGRAVPAGDSDDSDYVRASR